MKISSLQHPIVKHLVKLRKDKRYRYEKRSAVVIGKKMVAEVCLHQQTKKILVIDEAILPAHITADEVYLVNTSILKKISGVETPEGVLAEVALPEFASLEGCRYVVALDGVSDPGNLGTLLRTALAFGWEGVYILDNSCDPYNDKALRAGKGATFRIPVQMGKWQTLRQLITSNKLKPVVAHLYGKNLKDLSSAESILLVLSSEAHGLSPEAEECCEKVTIPMTGAVESLNVSVAGGILMYHIKP